MGRETQRDLKGKEMPKRSFRCYCDPRASVCMDRWLRVVRKGGQDLCAHLDLTPCLDLHFSFLPPGSTEQEGTFSRLEMVPLSLSDIPTDAVEIKTTSSSTFLLFFKM